MADASVLGIHPPNTVRIEWEGWVQDWPFDRVKVEGDRLVITGFTLRGNRGDERIQVWTEEPAVLYYPYEHAHPCCQAHATGRFFPPIGHPLSWLFVGGATHRDFTVTAGPPQPASVN